MNFYEMSLLIESTIVVYHGERGQSGSGSGSYGEKNQIGQQYSGSAAGTLGEWWGTNKPEYAEIYGDVKQYQITMNNPYTMPWAEFGRLDRGPGANVRATTARREELKQQGYDSVIQQKNDGTIEYILFDRTKAKLLQQGQSDQNLIKPKLDTLISQYRSSPTGGNAYQNLTNAVQQLIQQNPDKKDKIVSYFNSQLSR
jgi:hypothetical protein